jgi:predicted Zn-dependent peptidase
VNLSQTVLLRFRLPRLLVSALLAFSIAPALPGQATGRIVFERFALPNGLDVLLAPDHSTQVVAVDVWYLTGSRDEPPAKAGLARLFDRLMFEGSANVPAGVHAGLLEQAGGRVEGDVEEDVSRFTEAVPSNRINQALWLEADRMRGIVINDTTVGASRAGLMDDLRSRTTGEPYTGIVVDAVAALYDSTACPGYSHPPIGRAATISALTTQDAADFLNQHYRPNAARLVVAGDFDPALARKTITDYFGGIGRGPEPHPATCNATFSPGRQSRTVNDRLATRPAAGQFYRIPAHDHADTPALDLLGIILGQGQGGRLTARLSRELAAASAVQGGVLGTRQGPGVFGLFAVAGPGVSGDSLAALLADQATWAAGESLTNADLERARNIYLATAASRRERPQDVAEALQHATTFHGAPDAVNTEVDRVRAVTLADLRRAAATWLNPANALTVVITAGGAS